MAVAGMVVYGYIALTGRWIAWPVRAKKVPATARHRRLVGWGGVCLFGGLTLENATITLLRPHGLSVLLLALSIGLMLLGLVLFVMGWKRPDERSSEYRLEGWPPGGHQR